MSPSSPRLPRGRALLHLLARRFDHRNERCRDRTARQSAADEPSIDVNETTAFVLAAKRAGAAAELCFGRRQPQKLHAPDRTQIQEVLRIKEVGQDFFIRSPMPPDTGGLSGATPSEAVSWARWID